MHPSNAPTQTVFSRMTQLAQEHDAINLGQGFPDFGPAPELLDYPLSRDPLHHQYAPMPGYIGLREQISGYLKSRYNAGVHPADEITITAGATQGISTAVLALCPPGSRVGILEPAYDLYVPAIENAGCTPVCIRSNAPDWGIPWERLQMELKKGLAALIINTPNNPTGKIWSRDEWKQLAQMLQDSHTLVLSDEVYDSIVFDRERHISVLQVPELRDRSLAFFSFGKLLNITGWKVGYIAGDKALTERVRKVHQYMVFSVNAPAQQQLMQYFKLPGAFQGYGTQLVRKRDRVQQGLAHTRFTVLPVKGSYFQLIGFEAYTDESDVQLALRLVVDYGLALIPLSPFYKEGFDPKLLRLCFAKQDETLDRGIHKLQEFHARNS